jgi:hypothetical protein
MQQPLKHRIYNYLREWYSCNPNKWIHKAKFEELAKQNGYLADNAGRRLRELCHDGKVEKRESGKSIEYRYNPENDIVKKIWELGK